MQHASAGSEIVVAQTLLFLGATCLLIPALRKARISAVMGFLLIGVAMGPQMLGRLATEYPLLSAFDLEEAEPTLLLAELGVVFLLFIIGLEVSFERLWALKRYVLGLGVSQVVVTAGAIGAVALAFGNSPTVSAVLGLAFALSSTALVLQLLRERSQITTSVGRASFSVLLTQDLMVVPILFIVAALGSQSGLFEPDEIGLALLSAVAAIAAIVTAGRLLLRPLFRWVAGANSREVFIAAAFFAAIAMAAATRAAGLSTALGAFLAGMLLAETEFRRQIETDLEPFKDLLLGLFFVTVGMQIDVGLLLGEPIRIMLVVAGLFIVKGLIIAPLARAFGLPWPRAIELAFLLGQAGEFAFVVVAVARTAGAIPEAIADFMLLVTALSIFFTPLVATLGRRLSQRVLGSVAHAPPQEAAEERGHVVIAGFGRVGQTLADLLSAQDIGSVGVETDTALVHELQNKGRRVYYGDASNSSVLRSLGAARAAAIVVTINDPKAVNRIVAEARRCWPGIPVYARARDAAHARSLHEAGAALATAETVESALQLGEALLNGIGVPDEVAARIIDGQREAELNKALYGPRA
ncbi:MAG TPA: cation:proton antiporter [Vitreimonas sp.]|uniref:cation:proton antiporter domain-containing protein n=1 Tax=Vitreimonas sp. TaxID=3069702 RepID=UPI002D29A9F8|nr:cation:proton antiporter [Vitreimonas sp.]HYD87056.1 cation:proton antiporter [Vitreimonas sp.]